MTKPKLMAAGTRFLRDLAESPGWTFMEGGPAAFWRPHEVMAERGASRAELRSINKWTVELRVHEGRDTAWTYYRDYGGERGMAPDEPQACAGSPEAADTLLGRLARYMGGMEGYARRRLYEPGYEWEGKWET